MSRWFVCLAAFISLALPGGSRLVQAQAPASDTQGQTTAGASETPSESQSPSTQIAQPIEPADPLRSPRLMMDEFLLAIGESAKKPERMKDAVRCLDLSGLAAAEPKEAEKQGLLLARQLEQIIDALLNTYGKSLDEIPERPEGQAVVFPAEGDVQLVLMQAEDGRWRFSVDTVAAIGNLLEQTKREAKEQEKQAPTAKFTPGVPARFRSARATMRTFLEAMAEGDTATAARCLDLSEAGAAAREEMIGGDLAERLLFVMDRIAVVVYQKIPDRPSGEPYTWHIDEHGRIELARKEDGDRKGHWLFTPATVSSIEQLFKAFQDKPRIEALEGPSFRNSPRLWLLEKIPTRWRTEVWGVQTWQWVGIAALLVLGYAVHRAAFFIFCAAARAVGRLKRVELSPAHVVSSMRPLGMLVMVATWWGGLRLMLMPPGIMETVWPAMEFVLTVVGVWASYRLIDLASDYFATLAARTVSRLDDVLVPLVRKALKIIVFVVGFIFILKALRVEETTLNKMFAGLGLGGLAFALAAKDTLSNFFGSVTVVLDRPFQVGDWVKVGNVEGTVESVGLRSSRIRTFYNSQVTVPNAELITATVDNMGRRQYRRINCKISVTYSTTPEQLEAFCEGIRELIRLHPYTRKDYYVAWVNEFAASSINILLYCFHETPDWVTELRERHRLFLDIIRLANRLGVEFAFPTQTIHLAKEDGGDRGAPPPKIDKAPPGKKTSEEAYNWGRSVADEIARESIGNAEGVAPKFEFPEVG